MSAINEVPGRKAPSDALARSCVTELEAVKMAAGRASQVMDTVCGAFSLLVEEMADLTDLPDTDKLDRWCNVTYWLVDQLQNERANIASALDWKPS